MHTVTCQISIIFFVSVKQWLLNWNFTYQKFYYYKGSTKKNLNSSRNKNNCGTSKVFRQSLCKVILTYILMRGIKFEFHSGFQEGTIFFVIAVGLIFHVGDAYKFIKNRHLPHSLNVHFQWSIKLDESLLSFAASELL